MGLHICAVVQRGAGSPSEHVEIVSKQGSSQRTHTGDLILYAGLQAPVWKDESHVAYLRHPDGRIIDTMHAGRPPRHPDGHQ